MKLNLLDVTEKVSKQGVVTYSAVGLGNFSDFGNVRPATVVVKLTSEQYAKLKTFKGKEIDLDVIIPLSTFPLSLNSLNL